MHLSAKVKGIIFFGALICLAGISAVKYPQKHSKKINGVSFVAPVRAVGPSAITPIKKVHANWIAITPYAYSESGKPSVTFNYRRQWWGERKKGVVKTIKYAQNSGLKVMLKPHVWVHGQGWTGDFDLSSEKEWSKWQHDYTHYIVSFAKIADSLHVGLICIGTEYSKAVNKHPEIWRQLIKKVRNVYSGKLTYAANWDNYENITFWDALDYVGIDAYFPLSDAKNPTTTNLVERWQHTKRKLHRYSKQQGKPILFTEFGYQSVNYTADGHWKYKRGDRALNKQAQVAAYNAIFQTFWHENWFAGGFLWKWFENSSHFSRYHHGKGFSPQGKPAEKMLKSWYGQYR